MTERTTAPGDLGRRIAARRDRLGLSRSELALRAGIDAGYLGYLEENPAEPTVETVNALALALGTDSRTLLGADPEPAPGRGGGGQGPPHGEPVMRELDREECVRLLARGGVGRVAFEPQGGTVILPVNFVLDGDAVLFATLLGGALDDGLTSRVRGADLRVAFETDRIDSALHEGWSVLVRGAARHVPPEDQERAAATGVNPWAGGPRDHYIRVALQEVTGRRITHA